jgi:hypothetical protein
LWPEELQLAECRSVKSFDRNSWNAQLPKASTQFTSCAAGVGEGKYSISSKLPLRNAIGNSMGDCASFTGAGTGQYASRPNQTGGGFALFRV